MATKNVVLFKGHKLMVSDDGGSTWETVGCLTSFGLDQPERNKIDITCSEDEVKSYRFGLRDSGTVSLETFYDPTSVAQQILEDSYKSDDLFKFKIGYSNGTEKSFDGNVIALSESGEVDGVLTESVTIGLAGEITTTVNTSVNAGDESEEYN